MGEVECTAVDIKIAVVGETDLEAGVAEAVLDIVASGFVLETPSRSAVGITGHPEAERCALIVEGPEVVE